MRSIMLAMLLLLSGTSSSESSMFYPVFMPKSAYESLNPAYKVLGVEKKSAIFRIWLIATPESLNNLKSLRTITKSIYSNVISSLPKEAEWEAFFFTTTSFSHDNNLLQESNYLGLYMSTEREFFMKDGRSATLDP